MPSKKSKLFIEYVNYLRDQQALSEETIFIRKRFVEPFLKYLGKIAQASKLSKLSANTIHDYILVKAQPLHRASKKHLTSSIRSFLRFANIKGYLKRDLIEVVPVIVTRRLDSLPQHIPWEDIQKLLILPDRSTHAGRRDFAVLSLLISYGVRIGQVTTLKLQDICWQEGVINFAASKHSNALRFPLHKEVADALLAYIKKDRMTAEFQEVFLTIKEPMRPLSENNHYQSNIKKYFLKAGIIASMYGSRIIRHSFATQLVNQNISIKTISDLLGHRWIDTTFIYTKVNVVKLRELAREWPEVLQ
jgi:site-specific recombinase XerD